MYYVLFTDEYTLSRAMTLMVRRSESDSDSSGSPCAECNSSVSYRMPVTPGKGKINAILIKLSSSFKLVRFFLENKIPTTLIIPYSFSICLKNIYWFCIYQYKNVLSDEVFRAVTDSSAESAADARSVSQRPHDKSRRRPRRHHTPTSSR